MTEHLSCDEWRTLSEAYAFFGNSLLEPMTQTADVGLDPAFWEAFPDFDDAEIARAVRACADLARESRVAAEAGEDVALRCAVEFTRLFVGPPRPAAAPWETMHRHAGCYGPGVGFGEATFEMRALLREAGLELSNENRQYEDHIGIELLYLSEICRRAAAAGEKGAMDDSADGRAAEGAPKGEAATDEAAVRAFVLEHPLGWIGSLASAVSASMPGGYFDRLLALAGAVLRWHVGRLGEAR